MWWQRFVVSALFSKMRPICDYCRALKMRNCEIVPFQGCLVYGVQWRDFCDRVGIS